MARYIDADKLCKGLKEMASVQYPDKQNTILGVVSTIENTPTVDVVEVVRCKDCKHFMEYTEEFSRNVEGADGDCYLRVVCSGSIDRHFNAVQRDDFCSYGKQKDDT